MILGIDAGGTHTRFVLFNEKGETVHTQVLDSMHFMKVGYDGIRSTLRQYSDSMKKLGYDSDNFKVAIGIAGYGQDPSIRSEIEKAIYSVFKEVKIFNDAQFAHLAALENNDGVFVISGTGSIALAKHQDTFTRSGGFGYLIDDAGSAYWIGKHILESFVRQVDGRDEKSPLYDFLLQELDLKDPYQIIQTVFQEKENYRNYVANLAGLTKNLKDDTLNAIYEKAGAKLAELANVFPFDTSTKISVGGSVLLNNKRVQESFIKNLKPHFHFVKPTTSVEYAAYLLYQ